MELPNEDLANHLREVAYYYNLSRDTYRNKVFNEAAQKIEVYPEAIISGRDAKDKIGYGIGDSIMFDIDEFLNTGTSQRLESLKTSFKERQEVIDLFRTLHGVGPVTANKFYDAGFRDFGDLWYKAELTEAQKTSIFYREHLKLRIPRYEIAAIEEFLKRLFLGLTIEIVGSYRRGEPDSGDIDILIRQNDKIDLNFIVDELKKYNLLIADFAQGKSKYLGLIQLQNRPVRRLDILIIKPESWATALLYFTGSQRFNILMRRRAKDLGMRLNEYALLDSAGNRMTKENSTEQDVFNMLNLRYLTPQERTRDLTQLEFQ